VTRRSSVAARRFLLTVPIHRRDLEGHALVAYHLERRHGHEVVFSNVPGLEEAMLRHAPDVVVLDRIDTRLRVGRLAKSLGMKVALLPTVGFTPGGTEIEARRAGKLIPTDRLVDCCFTWGDQARQTVLAHTSLTASQVHTVGCPRFDCYSEPYLSLVEPREVLLQRLGLVATSAPLVVWTTNTYHVRTADVESTVAGAVASGVPEPEIREHLAHEGTAFRDLADATAAVARAHPEWNFLIKLHPAETGEPYRAIAAGAPNIALAGDVRIRDVLYHCDALLANCSTTATEAWMLGKPVFEVVFGSYSVAMPPGYLESNYVVRCLSDLDSLLQERLKTPRAPLPESQVRSRSEFLGRVYHRIDGKASERCAARLDELVSPARHTSADQVRVRVACASACSAWEATAAARFSNRVKAVLGMSRETSLRFWKPSFWRSRGRPRSPFIWDEAVTPQMVEPLFAQFDRAHAAPAAGGAGNEVSEPAGIGPGDG